MMPRDLTTVEVLQRVHMIKRTLLTLPPQEFHPTNPIVVLAMQLDSLADDLTFGIKEDGKA